MKKIVALLCVLFLAVSVFAQASSLAEPDPSMVGADAAAQALREISLDLFEREGSWNCRISPDVGVISGRLFDGGPYSNLDAEAKQEQIKLPAEVADAENEILRFETEIAHIEKQIANGNINDDIFEQHAEKNKQLENAMSHWELASMELEKLKIKQNNN